MLGKMSPTAQDAARELMEDHENIVLATDSHSLTALRGCKSVTPQCASVRLGA
jgi:hypothetical protein